MTDLERYSSWIKVPIANSEAAGYWDWCAENASKSEWSVLFALHGSRSTYCFLNKEDALAFKLRFGV